MRNFLVSSCLVLSSVAALAVDINGAGSTFAEPIYSAWFTEFQKHSKDDKFNYQGVGSGAGIKQMISGTVDFAGTDDPMNAEDSAKTKPVLHIPIAMGAVVVSYNVSGIKEELKLDGETIAKIFNGAIKKWNDPAIAALNKGVSLPDTGIVVITRSDSSGTTAVFSEYLSKVSKDWEGKNGKSVKWFEGSLGAKGNAGVAGLVKQTPGAVGYIELVYAVENKMPYATVKNKSGQFVKASTESVSAAAANTSKEAVKNNFKMSLTNSDQKKAYPIAAFTWMLVYETMPKAKGAAITNFAKWAMGEDAQKKVAAINYAPVPKDIRTEVVKALAKVKLE